MTETQLTNKIRQYLHTVSNLYHFKVHGGMYGHSGIPDIIICYHGAFVAIEVKVGCNKPTPLQELQLYKITQAGGIAHAVRSLNEVKVLIAFLQDQGKEVTVVHRKQGGGA